jgi:hypothetical protein
MSLVRGFSALLIATAGLVAVAPRSPAQEDLAQIELVRQPVWHDDNDKLNLRLRITNTSDEDLNGFSVVVGASSRVTTRSELHTMFDPSTFEPVSTLPLPLNRPNVTLVPAQSKAVIIRNPISNLPLITESGEAGVFPLKISLLDADGVPLDSLATQVLYYPEKPEFRLGMVPIVILNDAPARGPQGAFGPNETGDFPLEAALTEDGWLSGMVNALVERSPDLHLGIAPVPRLVEELGDMANGYRRTDGDVLETVGTGTDEATAAAEVIDELRTVMESRVIQPVRVPYSAPDLPSIASDAGGIPTQLDVGTAVISEVLGDTAAAGGPGWAYAPAGRLDAESLEQLAGAGIEHTFFSDDSLEAPANLDLAGCPVAEFSFACPIEVSTELGGSINGYALDPFLQEHLSGLLQTGLVRDSLQRFFAETAMIREEQPGTSGRVIAVATPAMWHPTPRIAKTFINALETAPWIETLTPGEGLEHASSISDKQTVQTIPPSPDAPDDSYFAAVDDAQQVVDQFASINPPADLIRRLGRNVLTAQSRSLWADPALGASFATESAKEITRELNKIKVIGPEEITLTSKEGQFEFIIVNENNYAVTVEVDMTSDKLDLPDSDPIDIAPGRKRVEINVTTQTSGTSRVFVQLRTPDGLEISDVTQIRVNSTVFNEIALGITFGAIAFVVIYYSVRGIRRRRNRGQPSTGASPA